MLAQEPWCFCPAVIAEMTDWQIEYLYARPAAERAEKLRREVKGEGATPPSSPNSIPHEPGSKDHKAVVVSAMMNGPLGMSRAKAEAAYEAQLAAYRKGQS